MKKTNLNLKSNQNNIIRSFLFLRENIKLSILKQFKR